MTTSPTKTSKKTSKKNPLKNPKGGLTQAGREHFRATEGANLKPGVQGKADTPEKMRRKGSFLRRHFAHPRGPMKDDQGKPTRLALSAHAWGEPVPKDMAAARRLATKGTKLLERYQATKKAASGTKKAGKAGPRRATRGTARKTGTKSRTRPAASAKRSTARRQPARARAKTPARRQKRTRG